ncbi:ATP synthase regulation protein NCA2-domain-containing protein [Infundibulicybe gibba]|nr:ATP synthase regulation protein NCA2-domain-containing protein [Infundibulicybe gibba]
MVADTLNAIVDLEQSPGTNFSADAEEEALARAVVGKLVVGVYAEVLDKYLLQATDAEAEAEWWADVERSYSNVAWYLLQSFPQRLANVSNQILRSLRARNIPLRSILNPASICRLFPSVNPLRPNALTISLFPHLGSTSLNLSSSLYAFSSTPRLEISSTSFFGSIRGMPRYICDIFLVPLALTRSECKFKKKELEKVRDSRAEILGGIANIRGELASALSSDATKIHAFVLSLSNLLNTSMESPPAPDPNSPLQATLHLLSTTLTCQSNHNSSLDVIKSLRRPSRLALLWPKLFLLPPLGLYVVRALYASRASLADVFVLAGETIRGFIQGWLIEPLKDVLQTVRAGSDGGVIVRKEGVAADLDSLERMTLSLARDELHYGPEQLAALSQQIRVGDLTPVLQLYEEDIRRPLKSALTGTLLRSVFIQVQKAKVDIDQALTGIDKLIKSQELTFAFVGVAPAFAIVYLFGGSVLRLWRGSTGRGKYGGREQRASVWSTIRRIERLLTSQPPSNSQPNASPGLREISPLTTGLLLLSVARLRVYAENYLPLGSRIRDGFLEDVEDLENPDLGRAEKMRVVERMWRCWGQVLGWRRIAVELA